MAPKRALQAFRPTRMVLAMLAVAIVAALVASFVTSPSIDRSQERTDPLIAVPEAASDRTEPPSRAAGRAALAPGPSATPSASASPSASPTPTPSEEPTTEAAPSPTPTATKTAEPTPTPTPTPVPELGSVTGEMWATTSVNIRSGPGTGFGVVTAVRAGHELTVTNVVVDDRWQQVRLDGSVGFVSNRYLTDDEPAAPAPTPTRESEPSAQPSEAPEQGVSLEACRAASGIESGLTGRTVDVLRAICNEFPSVSSYGGYRSGGGSYHSQGRAIDVMISGEAGWEVARWVRANASELGVIEVIYAQRIWTTQRAGEGWRPMSDRGSASANHYDHVHVSVR